MSKFRTRCNPDDLIIMEKDRTMRPGQGATRIRPWLLALAFLLAACSKLSPTAPTVAPLAVPGTPPITPTFTPAFTPTLTVTSSPPTDTPPLRLTPVHTPSATPTRTPPPPTATPTAEPGPLPALLVQIPLAPPEETLQDLLLDSDTGRLYVTDTAGQLHVLDADTYAELATLPAAGNLTLDAAHDRLYTFPPYGEGDVTVVDTALLTVVGTVSPGGFVAVDSVRNRFYVGQRVYYTPPEDTPGVRVYDGATLEQLGEVPQPGIPVYNPLRDELYIVAYTVHQANPETLQITGDLLPEITAQPLPWCNSCRAATNAYVFPERNLLLVDVITLSTGGGPGYVIGPRFFDAATLDEITDVARTPAVQRGCENLLILADPVKGRSYRNERYVRYVVYNNLLVYGPDGALETWRDGLPPGITNPHTGQMYLPHGDDLLVLDLATLTPLGTIPAACIHTLDAETERFYALREADLVVFSEGGGRREPPPTGDAGPLPAEQVHFIRLSPDYPADQTLFLGISDGSFTRKLYRSADGGQTWTQLRGGLPEGSYLALDLAISPAFGADRTLFAGGFRSDFWGEGIHRSTDGGDTWQPMWDGLTHLRVYDVALSPDYAADGTLLAYANYQRITPWNGGRSIFRSTDRGLNWSLVMTSTLQALWGDMPPPEEFLPPGLPLPTVRFRSTDYGRGVERTTDGGETWEPVVVTRQPEFTVRAILPSPNVDTDHTVYVLSDYDLFRSTDGGEAWERWPDERLAGRDYFQRLTAGAISPLLDDGRYQLFIGTAVGEFWALGPAAMAWEPVQIAAQWPTVLKGEWVGEIEIAPDGSTGLTAGGDVWLGTWGGGLARYAAGAIQAHYTITDGLPSQFVGGVATTPGGTLWVGGDLPPGVASFDGQTWTAHPFDQEDVIGGVFDVTIGPDGVVWVGAQTSGILRWDGQAWERITDPEGRIGWRTYEIEIGPGGALWCATTSGLAFYSDGVWSGNPTGESLDVEFGPDGAAYLLTGSGVIWRYADGQWTTLPPPKKIVLGPRALYAAGDGAVWLGTSEGAFRYDGQAWQQFTAQDGLPDNQVTAIAEDAGGWLWFGTKNGAARADPATLNLSPVAWPPSPTPTPAPPVAPTPTPCALSPAEPFAAAYADENGEVAARLACPLAEATVTWAAFQPFERALMFWRADRRDIDVLHTDGWWAGYDDTWDESQPVDDPSLTPPEGLLQPIRGFGKVWRGLLGGPQVEVGWALESERGYEMTTQSFGGGWMFLGAEGEVFILYVGGTWEREA